MFQKAGELEDNLLKICMLNLMAAISSSTLRNLNIKGETNEILDPDRHSR